MNAGIDLLVVDEAQRLRRPPGHPGEPAWRAIAPIAGLGRHVLLLSATPLEDDAHGFFRLLQLLRPEEFPEDVSFEARLALATPLPPCTSSTRRADIGGLPPRVGIPIALDDPASWRVHRAVEATLRGAAAPDAVARRQKIDRVRRALASGAALSPVLGPDERALRQQAEAMDAGDPRLLWLLSQAPRWRDAREKTLVFVAHRETLEMLRTALSHRAQLATGVFHEELSPARRDTEVARFREPDGPSLLVSTECGGEGRNFEFCRRLVLFDLPWKPSLVEQRIGRLDRIGRRIPVEIVYFRPPGGIGADVVRLFEALGLFREPLAGLEPQLAHVEGALEVIALDPLAALSGERFEALVSEAHAARTRIREAAYQQLHRDPYRSDMAASILARVPGELDAPQRGGGGHGMHRPGVQASSVRAAAGSSRSSSVTERRSTACRASPAGRAMSAHSTARRQSRTRPSTSLLPGIRSWRASLPTTRRAPWDGSLGSKSRSPGNTTRGSLPSTRTGRSSRWLRSTPPARLGRTGWRSSANEGTPRDG